ncbi:MAG: glycosyltransferase [Chloroflexi bacterium]|nr:glycosyltransferase [Chloroflexota bacterium]
MKRILILMSDTGGGHRAAAEAIEEALYRLYGREQVFVDIVDVFRHYSPYPINKFPEIYPWLVNNSKRSYALIFKMSNKGGRARALTRGVYFALGIERGFKRLLREHPADLIVSVHPLVNRPMLDMLYKLEQRPAFMTVVTDLVSGHVAWWDARVDRCLVPTQPAFDAGLQNGMRAEQMRVTGLPVHPHFAEALTDKASARKELGWAIDRPAVLMVYGGDGMGPVYQTVQAINARTAQCQLIVVAGRNKALKEKLDTTAWNTPVIAYPFVTNMPRLMAAADVLVTKAGPATISEACIAGLPLIISDAIPGQEEGNVTYVTDNDAGVFAPTPEQVAEAVSSWLAKGPGELQRLAERARHLARPEAVWDIAGEIWDYAQRPLVQNPPRKRLFRRRVRRRGNR